MDMDTIAACGVCLKAESECICEDTIAKMQEELEDIL